MHVWRLKDLVLLHPQVVKSCFKNHDIVENDLINMYSNSENIDSMYNVFSNMVYRYVITWNAMTCIHSHRRLGKQVLLVF
uniref:Pentatricopeptide repeat-containing protein At5g39680 family n=1 Tax=Cajanus cajan TaxID=3821 RepID=A0A151RK26_CAJCA|nr:Pentatricopeptide repeat-containing protein At5g39680 family [Cajanus cajan]